MKSRVVAMLLCVLLLATVAEANEWKGKKGLGLHGIGLGPMFEGSGFDRFEATYEPFEMAWSGGLQARYGYNERIVFSLGYSWMNTYDDSEATGDQTFGKRDIENASAHLRGMLTWLTASYHFRVEEKLQPFVMSGFGIDHWRIRLWNPGIFEDKETHEATDLSFKLGGGLNYWLLSWVTVDAQLRFTYGLTFMSRRTFSSLCQCIIHAVSGR